MLSASCHAMMMPTSVQTSFASGTRISKQMLKISPASTHARRLRSEEHTSELQSLMRISYAGFCLKKKRTKKQQKLYQYPTNKKHPQNQHMTKHSNSS